MTSDRRLSNSTVTAIMHVPLENGNIADWLLTLPDAEYQRCSHAHIAAGTFIAFIQERGITLEQASAARQIASDEHNREETPNFAANIERHALKRSPEASH